MTMTLCILCLDDYPADLVVAGHCYLCHEALSCAEARALDAPDDDAARELAAHYDATRLDYAEIRTRALAEARYPGQEVWCHASPPRGRASERHYILCGRTRTAHFTLTLGGGACGCDTPEAAWAEAEASLRREVEARIDIARRQRDLLDAEIARLTAALEVAT